MYTVISTVTDVLSVLTLITQIFIVATLIAYAVKFKTWTKFFEKHSFKLALTIALTAMIGSLFYSDYAGYTPCLLCWYQRIAIYPVSILLITAFATKSLKQIPKFILPLSIIGVLISGFHYLEQVLRTINPEFDSLTDCSVYGATPSCVESYVMHFGYITIPNMALTAGLAIVLLMIMGIRYNKKP